MFGPPSAASRSGRSRGTPRPCRTAPCRNKNTECWHEPKFGRGSQRVWSYPYLNESNRICRIKPNRRGPFTKSNQKFQSGQGAPGSLCRHCEAQSDEAIHGCHSEAAPADRSLLPLPALRGERDGVRGCFRKFRAWVCAVTPLTRVASQSDLSPQAGRGEAKHPPIQLKAVVALRGNDHLADRPQRDAGEFEVGPGEGNADDSHRKQHRGDEVG